MAQDQNLHILGGSAASEQPEPAEDCDTEQIQQSEQHGSRSCHDHAEPTKPQLTGLVTSFGTLHGRRHLTPVIEQLWSLVAVTVGDPQPPRNEQVKGSIPLGGSTSHLGNSSRLRAGLGRVESNVVRVALQCVPWLHLPYAARRQRGSI